MPPASDGELAPGHLVADRYEVRGLLGRGGYGLVYEAIDRVGRRIVALKVLRADRWSETTVRRFRREAELARHLRHHRLARVYDTGTDGENLYLTMERVRGESLACCLQRGRLPVAKAAEIAAQVAEALAALHDAGLVHRDVKPSNVLLDGRGWSKLADFGLTRCAQEEAARVTGNGEAVGTAEYMAPEEALGEPLDARSDLYSLGVVLYEMLTGEPPHLGRTPLGTLLAHLQRTAPDVRSRRPEVPAWLAGVVARLLARHPEARYPTARAVLDDLRARRSEHRDRRTRVRRAAVLGTLLVLAACTLAVRDLHPASALRGVATGPDGLIAVGASGEVLWRLPDQDGDLVRARLKPDEPERLVGLLSPSETAAEGTVRELSVLDAETGETIRTVELPSGAGEFSGFADRYGARVAAADLDGDGLDEVVLSYYHSPYWPSYVVVYEPLLERARIVFYGSGHHRFAGPADVDGDGQVEIILTGINNRLGYVPVVAAVRPVPGINRPAGAGGLQAASSPDAVRASAAEALAWYALLPRRAGGDFGRGFTVDSEARTIRVGGTAVEAIELSFDGFVVGRASTLPPERRREARARGYARLREAKRLSAAGFSPEALAEIGRAVTLAVRVNDPVFVEHARRVQAQLLIAAGRHEDAEALFTEIAVGSRESPEVAFDAGRAFHLAGELDRAVRWYRRSLGPGGTSHLGRGKYEFLEGLVFALEELGRPEEALAEIDRFEASWRAERGDPREETVALFRDYLRWRRGRRPSRPWDALSAAQPDVFRYLALEMRLARGDAPEDLLAAVEAELGRSSETVPMLLSFRAVLLRRLGRLPEARESARGALEEIAHRLDDEIYGRVFGSLVQERASGLDGREGDSSAVHGF